MALKNEIKQSKFKSPYDEAFLNLLFTNERLSSEMKLIFKSFELTESQFNILRILLGAKDKKMSPGEIKDVMIFKNSDITRLIDRLVKKHYVIRNACPVNRRKVDLEISKEGKMLLQRINPVVDNFVQSKIGDKISEKEAYLFIKILEKLRS